jgi:magnesium-transporting ATPase (P-type)
MIAGTGRPSQEKWHALTGDEVVRQVQSDVAQGLAPTEAARRLSEWGPNTLPETKGRSIWIVIWRQFASPLIYILFLAAGIALFLGKHDDAIVILVVVLINAAIGVFQEHRAEKSMEALRRLSALHVRVIRGGNEEMIEAGNLVPGDVMLLAAGDAVGADARLLEAVSLGAAEAALTGESLPVSKSIEKVAEDTPLADRANMIYAGTHLASGRGRAVVVATGQETEIGKIADLTATAEEPKTPLEVRLEHFGRWLVVMAAVLFAAVVGLGLLRGLAFGEVLMVAISQMVSMVPEGLPVAMTIALAVGMQRMAAKGAIVRRLAAVETLGSTTVICSDKTGTLTKNEMTVTALWLPDGRTIEVSGVGYEPTGKLALDGRDVSLDDPGLRTLLEAAVLCNDSKVVPPDGEETRWRALGDPTEAALLTLAAKAQLNLDDVREANPRDGEIPFDSTTKMMATRHGGRNGTRVWIKGAPEALLSLCSRIRRGGEDAPMDEAVKKQIEEVGAAFANRALRLLAFAEVPGGELDSNASFDQFSGRAVLLGLVGEIDPPRDEVREAVTECKNAGIRAVMVTGDHKATGLAVARALGISEDGDRVVDGVELEKMSDEELRSSLESISVFARVPPAQKLRIVEAFQSRGQIAAMTGDGVNDAPALARADVGVAMGITGTEVAKGAAKIVITDDNFATIVRAVEQGRLVYRNLQKVLLFLFATSLDEVILVIGSLMMGLPLPLSATQILWINLVTEGVITVNLIMEGLEGDEMRRCPTRPGSSLFTRTMIHRLILMGGISSAMGLGYFWWRLSTGAPFPQVQTEVFTLVAVCQWFNVVNCRSEMNSALNFSLLKNYWLLGGLVLGVLLQFMVIYYTPLGRIFHTVPIAGESLLLITGIASGLLWAEEIRKWFARRAAARVAGCELEPSVE